MPRALIDQLFDLGVMGIEIPERLRRRRRQLLPRGARRRGALARRPVGRRARRRAEHAGHQRPAALGHRRAEAALPAAARGRRPSAPTRCPRPARAATPSRWRRARSSATDGFVAHRPQALDHQRQRGRPLHRLRQRQSGGRLPRHHGVPRRARVRRASRSARRRTSSASARAARASCCSRTAACRRANVLGEVGKGYKVAIETLNEGRIGIGAQMIGLAQGALDHAIAVHEGAQAVRQGDRRVPGACSSSSRGRPPRSRRRGCWSTTRRGCATRASRSSPKRRCASCSRRRSAERVTSLAVNLFGGYGYVKDYPVEKLYRDAEDRPDLRGHVEHAAADDRQADAGVIGGRDWESATRVPGSVGGQ